MKIEDLERLLVSTLRTALATEKTQVGQTKEWIYVDYPRTDATMPRISITETGSPQTPAGIGGEIDISNTLGVYEATSFDIDIWVHRTNKTTGLSPQRGGTSLRDWLADRIVTVLLTQKPTLIANNSEIIDIEKTGEMPHPYDEDTELFQKTLTILVTHLRTW